MNQPVKPQLPASVGPPPQTPKQLPASVNSSEQSSLVAWMTPEVKQFCEYAVQSGYFEAAGIKNVAHAVMKVAFGQELGLSPAQSLNELYVVRGKVLMEPNAIATHIATHGRYNIDIVSLDDDQCTVQITYDGKPKGSPVQFTYAQAVKAKWTVDQYGKPKPAWDVDRQMQLYYKAAARGQRLYARDLYKVTVYDRDEITAESVTLASDEATAAVATAGTGRRRRQDPAANKDVVSGATAEAGLSQAAASEQQNISDAEVVTESSEKPAEGTPIPNQPAVAYAPKSQAPAASAAEQTAASTDSPTEARKVTPQEVQNGMSAIRSSGWTTMNLTPIAKERYQVAPLINLSTAQFADLIAWASDNKPAK